MVAFWMCYATFVTALLVAGAWAADGVFASLGRSRRWAWAAAVAGGLVLPGWAGWRATHPARTEAPALSTVHALGTALANARVVNAVRASESGTVATPELPPSRAAVLRARAERATVSAARGLAPFDRPLLAAWLVASVAGLAFVVQGAWAIRRRRSDWRIALIGGERVWLASDLGPALVGALRPRVVLPAWLIDALDVDELRLVLAHERAHAAARDPLLLAFAVAALIATPWNAALWLAARRLRLAAEGDCDRRVLRAHPDVRRYAKLLVDVAERALGADGVRGVATMATALLDPPGLLERRVAWLLGDEQRAPGWRVIRVAGAVVGTLGVAVLACAVPRPAPAPVPVARGTATAVGQLNVSPTCAARASCIAAELSAARAARSVDSMTRALDRAWPRLDTARLALDAARLASVAQRMAMAVQVGNSIATVQRAETSQKLEQLDSAMRVLRLGAEDRRSMSVDAGQFAALRAQFTALRAYAVQQSRVDSLFSQIRAAGQAFARDPHAQARFDSTIEALRSDVRRARTVSLLVPASAADPRRLAPVIPLAKSDTSNEDTSATSPRRLHDLAREIAMRTPRMSGRNLTIILFDTAGAVQRSVIRSLRPGEHVSLTTDAARRVFPELGRRSISLGNMTWLAPNDSAYVVWVMPSGPR